MNKTLLIPKTIEDQLDISEWLHFIIDNRYDNTDSDIKELTIDFGQTEYIYTLQLASLACLLEEYDSKDIGINFINCDNPVIGEYLDEIKFFDYWTEGFDRTTYTKIKNIHCVWLWKIHPNMINPFLDHFKRIAEQQWVKGKDFSPLHTSLAEVFNNIKDHSKSEISGYAIIQHHPRHKKIRISVCDFGVGISHTVHQYMLEIENKRLSNLEALEKAFELKFTIKSSPQNRGFGLDTLRQTVSDLGGILRVFTNDVTTEDKPNYHNLKTSYLNNNFGGTIVDIIIDTDDMWNINEESEDFMF